MLPKIDDLVHGGDDGAGQHSYAYRPRMIGAATRVVLDTRAAEGALDWTVGARSGRMLLKDIIRLRLRHELGQLGSASYALIIEARGHPAIRIGSHSRTGLTAVKEHGPAFVAFVHALHGALAREGLAPRFMAGLPAWRWWMMAACGGATGAGILWLAAMAFANGMKTEAWVTIALALVLGWPLTETLWRNRPGTYAPSAPPARLLPSS
ncbi:hypothetical protein ACLBXM_03895 [Xanthobacteraceae bacterium A53D]